MRRSGTLWAASTLLIALLPACGGCDEDEGMDRERTRLWGREKVAAEVEKRAKEPIDPRALDDRPDVKSRVLNMRWAEVVARLGFVTYTGKAIFDLERNGHALRVYEDTTIEHGLHGGTRVLQKDEDGAISRETLFTNGVYFVRNGPGKLRVAGKAEAKAIATAEEAFEALKSFTAYYGPRLGLAEAGTKTIGGRSAVAYDLVLLEGSQFVEVPGMKGKKKPVSLKGKVYVDEQTAAPIGAKLRGRLEIPPGEPDGGVGVLELSLDFTIETREGKELEPGEYIPTIEHRPVDLNPVAFLDGGTRTSTVIGGKKDSEKKAASGD